MSYTRGGSSVATAILPAVEVAFRLVDVFTEAPFAGNQLCVVPEPPAGLDDGDDDDAGARDRVLRDHVRDRGRGAAATTCGSSRPVEELPFAGHPTLGTAFTMVSEGRVRRER